MTPAATADRAIDARVLHRAGERLGVSAWPVVLDLQPGTDDAAELHRQSVDADRALIGSGLFASGEAAPWLESAVHVLAYPDRQLEIRTFTGGRTIRTCIARRGHDHVVAVRDRDDVEVRSVRLTEVGDLAALVRRCCGDVPALPFIAISRPSDEIVDRLGCCAPGHQMTDALHAMGASPTDAVVVSTALAACHARTEIVAVARDGVALIQSHGAVGIFDADNGRILASPSESPDGQVWTTLSPGSGHRIAQAIGLLVETLPDGRWFR